MGRSPCELTPELQAIMAARFWPKVEKTEGCWLWRAGRSGGAGRNAGGYGMIPLPMDGASVQTWLYVHRLSWMLTHGSIPKGLSVLHRCDVRNCVRPEHLFIGTQADNMHDMRSKGRGALQGKLTAAQVIDIRRRYRPRDGTVELAQEFGVSLATVNQIANRRTWRHLP